MPSTRSGHNGWPMELEDRHTHATMSVARIETLADGVFAIAMTLLAFNLTVPVLDPRLSADQVAAGLPGQIYALGPAFVVYALSFVVLGVYWVGHHAQFRVIDAADRAFLWINILFMMLIALVPFSTLLLSRYPLVPIAAQVYGIVLTLIGGAFYLHWRYATKGHRLVPPSTTEEFILAVQRRILIGPTVCAIAVLVAFVSTIVSIFLYAFLVPFYIAPGSVDRIVFRVRRSV
ncbi:MAG: DUF1211 domain-containing protein [Methanobacteriota archaeon]|nr:MAG: DUF1211 domain-containing protein [Euryarchaeota archaeon]